MNPIKKPNKVNPEESIKEIYKKILLRDPDRFGLDYYVSQMKNGKLTQSDIEKQLYDSEEAQSIRNFSHYSDKYWNDLNRVGQYKNNLQIMKTLLGLLIYQIGLVIFYLLRMF